jgi:mannose-6-phosphate isomerase-like protein (cupin superfamily)
MSISPRPPFGRGPDEAEHLSFGSATMIVHASAETTGGAFTLFEELPPLLDTSTHVHEHEDEMYYVLEGEHEFTSGELTFRVGPGGFVFLPRHVPHSHRRLRPGEGRLLGLTSPAGLEGFFRILGQAETAELPGPDVYSKASALHGITWLP